MTDADRLRRILGPSGIWVNLDVIPAVDAIAFARLVEDLGFGALWINESTGREPFAFLGALARETSRLTLGLGIAATHARDAAAAHNGARTLAELSADRFVMGLGVSHRSSAGRRGHDYGPPLPAMTAYLDAYGEAPWTGLAATRAAGAFPFLVTVERVAHARRVLDTAAAAAGRADRPVLVVSQKAILGSGSAVLETARAAVARYLAQPAYRSNLVRGGFSEADIDAVADPLVEALVATGEAADLRARIAAMHEAGADHVAVIPIAVDGRPADPATTRAVAPTS
jgi:probable F420-dependent oxidoreductase